MAHKKHKKNNKTSRGLDRLGHIYPIIGGSLRQRGQVRDSHPKRHAADTVHLLVGQPRPRAEMEGIPAPPPPVAAEERTQKEAEKYCYPRADWPSGIPGTFPVARGTFFYFFCPAHKSVRPRSATHCFFQLTLGWPENTLVKNIT